MPIWLIESFGEQDLNAAFLFILFMTAPVWIGMIVFPQTAFTRLVAQPWRVVPLYVLVLLVIVWRAFEASVLPMLSIDPSYNAAQAFTDHPIAFLVLFCNLQILNLFMGVIIYQKAKRHRFRPTVELLVCWFFGALALIPFGIRLLVRGQSTV